MLGSQRSHCHNKTNSGFVDSSEGVGSEGGKDECQVRLTGIELEYWMGTKIGRLGGNGFPGTIKAGDGSNQKGGKMDAGYVNLLEKRKRQQRKVGREEEGSSSNRSELAAFVLALRSTPVATPHAVLVRHPSAAESCKKMDR